MISVLCKGKEHGSAMPVRKSIDLIHDLKQGQILGLRRVLCLLD